MIKSNKIFKVILKKKFKNNLFLININQENLQYTFSICDCPQYLTTSVYIKKKRLCGIFSIYRLRI